MADHQKIHPVHHDAEAPPPPPTAPLVPPGTSKSDKGDPAVEQYRPFRRTIPVIHSKPPKRRSCCCKCFCWTTLLLFLIIIIIGIIAAIVYFVFQPKIPKYSVDSLQITQFSLNGVSLDATFNVNITATNPNKKIGVYYENGSKITVLYTGTELCQGSLPVFYQGHRNTTVMDVALTGQTQNATVMLQSLQADQQAGLGIPLDLRVRVPVRIKLGSLKLMKWKFLGRCNLVVDSLVTNNVVSIKSSSCKFKFRL
ncbi:NDR1/HIN1-like protein 6 [Camellia lanceoleosa]|uniref:NDR1/HIN1-like protein 6 n=1 Tax=Camellia lanceoleosa TaxID=1840588 RepID=A0ACC0I4G3_9ERIC|nr:NDR1/HIN1-like protein 6 [Camellia lanceoleosa]